MDRPQSSPRKGRGATANPEGRFESLRCEAFDDGWDAGDEQPPPLKTIVREDHARSIISRNDSPDLPFDQSINPYRGCEHGCVYCLSGDTQILIGDGTLRPLAEVRAGDVVYGTFRQGWYRRYQKAVVLDHWRVKRKAYRITLEDGTSLVAGADHRFLTERGWKFVTAADAGRMQRPHLTTRNKLMGTGAFALPPAGSTGYQRGYLCGIIRGDGLLASYRYQRAGRLHGDQHQFRLALCDKDALQRVQQFLQTWQITVHECVFQAATAGRRIMHAIRTHARADVERIRALIAWPDSLSKEWSAGFLAGIFDAEGSFSGGVLRISNTDKEIISRIGQCLGVFDFRFILERATRGRNKPIEVVRVIGGLREHLRFMHSVDPAIARKRDLAGQAVKSDARLRVVSVEPLAKPMRLYDITTSSGDFIANGVVSHNCYARPSHAYLGLSPGLDFESRLFYKPEAAALLRRELAAPRYRCRVLALGTNTDPYQPVERELRIMRSILEVLHETNHPVCITTKSSLVERDLDLLAGMARRNLAQVAVSITTLDHALARRLEPRASAPRRRLETIRRLAEAGIPARVMVAPVIPVLTDAEMETVLDAARAAGARNAGYVLLRLPGEVAGLFRAWLDAHFPLKAGHVMSAVRQTRGGRDNDSAFGRRMRGSGEFAGLIARRFELAVRRLGYDRDGAEFDTASFRPPGAAVSQPGLFD